MATIFKLEDLSSEQHEMIHELLTLERVDAEAEKAKKWKKFGSMKRPEKKLTPIEMYQIERRNPETGEIIEGIPSKGTIFDSYIRVPYRFGCFLAKKMVNTEKTFARLLEMPTFATTLREYQVNSALEALSQLEKFRTTSLCLPPGFGKTMLGAWLWMASVPEGETPYICCVLVHRLKIAEAWVKTFRTAFPELSDSIWVVGADPMPEEGVIPPIIICMDGRTHLIPPEVRYHVGFLIIDEAHCFCTEGRVGCLLAFEPLYVVVETATLVRDDGSHSMMYSIAGEHNVYKISDKPYRLVGLETGVLVPEVKNGFGVNYGDLLLKLCTNELRNHQILDIIQTNPHRKFMVLSKRAEGHLAILEALFKANGIEYGSLYGSKQKYKDSHVFLGTIDKVGTGFDEENACESFQGRKSDTLILACSIKKPQAFEQIRGRIMRSDDPVVIYMVDRNRTIRNHYNGLMEYYLDTKATIYDLAWAPKCVYIENNEVPKAPAANGGAGKKSKCRTIEVKL
jgi:hypothetical protein